MDNGYHNWKEWKQMQNKKRKSLFIKLFLIIVVISLIVFFFGYDEPLFSKQKIIEFFGGLIGLFLLSILFPFIIYKTPKYIPICNKCGRKIHNIEVDCIIGNIEKLGTIDKTVYENVKSTIKGKTVFPRGGYSMRNSDYEHTSESNYEMNTKIPLIKRFYVYNIEYCCKTCHEPYCKVKKESLEPLKKETNYE